MKITILIASSLLVASVSCIYAYEQPCGGILEGDNGNFQFSPSPRPDGIHVQNCIWLLRATGASKLLLTFNELVASGNNSLILYLEAVPTGTIENPITVTSEAVGSTLDLHGSTVILILPQVNSSISFTWDSEVDEGLSLTDPVTMIADYIETPVGKLTWSPRRSEERLLWIIGFGQSPDDTVQWRTRADLGDNCDKAHPCTCLSFGAYGISSEGYLVEIAEVCGTSSFGGFQMQSYPLLIVASANTTEHVVSGIELWWTTDKWEPPTCGTTTTAPTTPPEEAATHIYFGTYNGGIKALSLATYTVTTVVDSDVEFRGVAYDSIHNKLYYSRYSNIHRANLDGSEMETLESNVNGPVFTALAFEELSGNLFALSQSNGSAYRIIVCNAASLVNRLVCVTVINYGNALYGISLDPLRGEMFIAGFQGIHRAEMDGSNFRTIVPGRSGTGITVAYPDSDRLYWAEYSSSYGIASCLRNGSSIQTIVQLDSSAYPWGLVTFNGSLYWGSAESRTIQRSSTAGEDVVTLYSGTEQIRHFTLVPSSVDLSGLRNENALRNPCAGQPCSHICVPKASSFRCICPEGMRLAEDGRSCI